MADIKIEENPQEPEELYDPTKDTSLMVDSHWDILNTGLVSKVLGLDPNRIRINSQES
jgi:hypothetical protein